MEIDLLCCATQTPPPPCTVIWSCVFGSLCRMCVPYVYVLSSWEFGTMFWPLSCLCVGCCWESKGLDMGPSLFRCFGLCGCGFVIATLLPPRMMHVVLMHLAWAVYVCTVSSYFSITLFYIFLTPNTHYPMSPLSYLVTNISSILYVASQTLKQPALVWMHKIKALHFNEQLFKVRFLVAWYGCVCM